jgi:alpha-D-ribose 1-methylphosphonate 5-phosphate C-P lyase
MKHGYTYGFIDESSKREIRRALLKAVALPGHQVPFGSPELPIARGWGTGGLQITLSVIGRSDILKVIDQGSDDSVNAVNIKKFISAVTDTDITEDTTKATLIQTRHRIPEEKLSENQILIYQVPLPEPLRLVEHSESETRRMHAEGDYSSMWLYLYETIVKFKEVTIGDGYPVMVHNRYMMSPSPIPRWDVPKMHHSNALQLFGAGREKRIYAIPPYTDVAPIEFEDYPFRVEDFNGAACCECGSSDTYLDEIIDDRRNERRWACSDTSNCAKVKEKRV